MRSLLHLGSLVLIVTLMGGCASSSKRLIGAWELVSTPSDQLDLAGNDPPSPPNLVKILSEDRFAFGRQEPDGGLIAGGGTYELDGDVYTERVEYHWIPQLVGRELRFEVRVEDDRWIQTGSFVVEGRRFDISEVWRRVIADD
jgi:hypothetical protein